MVKRIFLTLVLCATTLVGSASLFSAELELSQGDRICLVGNALGERLQHNNTWEAMLHSRFPNHNLVVRNLCVPGDEPFERLRTLNFGEPDVHLTHSKADVILYFFGFGESFDGEKKAADFGADIDRLIKETQGKRFSEQAPRIVFVSPIAFENTGDPNLPDGKAHNRRLKAYTEAMKKACRANKVGFVNLHEPTLALFAKSDDRLTLNGAHLNQLGYTALAPILMNELFGASESDGVPAELLAEIDDKNFHWWHRYRAVNGSPSGASVVRRGRMALTATSM